MFLPSVGGCLALGVGTSWLVSQAASWTAAQRGVAAAVGLSVLAAGAIRSAVRQPVWRNTGSLHDQLLIDAPRSYRSQWIRGLRLYAARDHAGGDQALQTALALFPDDPALLAQLGDRYRGSNRCPEAIPLYRRSLVIDARKHYLRRRIVDCLVEAGRVAEAREEAGKAVAAREPGARRLAARVDTLVNPP